MANARSRACHLQRGYRSAALAVDAPARAAQLAGGLVEGEQHGVGCGRGRWGVVVSMWHQRTVPVPERSRRGGTRGAQPHFGGTRWGARLEMTRGRQEPPERRRRAAPLMGSDPRVPVCAGHAVNPSCAPVGIRTPNLLIRSQDPDSMEPTGDDLTRSWPTPTSCQVSRSAAERAAMS